jgi:hypothetical protein
MTLCELNGVSLLLCVSNANVHEIGNESSDLSQHQTSETDFACAVPKGAALKGPIAWKTLIKYPAIKQRMSRPSGKTAAPPHQKQQQVRHARRSPQPLVSVNKNY